MPSKGEVQATLWPAPADALDGPLDRRLAHRRAAPLDPREGSRWRWGMSLGCWLATWRQARAGRRPPSDRENIEEAARAAMVALESLWSTRAWLAWRSPPAEHPVRFSDERTLFLHRSRHARELARCAAHATLFPPEALNLAHFLADLGTDGYDIIGSPVARLRRQTFAESALEAASGSIACAGQGEPRRGPSFAPLASADLAVGLAPGLLLRGLWHGFIHCTARRRIDALITGSPRNRSRPRR